MGKLALRSARDPAIRDLFQKTVDVWRSTIRELERSLGLPEG
jgi:hypothetical protein